MTEGGWNDPEAIEQERRTADIEQANLDASGRDFAKRMRKSAQLRAQGKLVEAAAMCPHGGGYPLRSLAAAHMKDPRQGEDGVRCSDCGSVLTTWWNEGGTVVYFCERWS